MAKRIPKAPSLPEREHHALTHAPYAPWCESCIAGRGVESQHRKVEKQEDAPVVIQLDYMYMRTKGENDETLCCLQAYNMRTG